MTIAQSFLELMLQSQALRFGNFTTKSGRNSPYFFNSAQFYSGRFFGPVADLYASLIMDKFDLRASGIFGPSYKGIALATIVTERLYQKTGRDLPCYFDRKEAKTHGEGGIILGRSDSPQEPLIIVEDALTQGNSIKNTMTTLAAYGSRVIGVVVGLDRCERGFSDALARDEIEKTYDVPVYSLLDTKEMLALLKTHDYGVGKEQIAAISGHLKV